MSGGDGSASTPPTPIASTASPVPPISPFLTPAAAAAGIRYPLYVQSLYSPAAIFGQTVLPWRSINTQLAGSSSPTTATSNIMQSPAIVGTSASPGHAQQPQQTVAAQQLVNVPNLTSITPLPSLVYPLPMPTVLTAQGNINSSNSSSAPGGGSTDTKKLTGPSITTLKRHSDGSGGDNEIKRQRLSDGSLTPHSPSLTSSSSSHPSTPTQFYKQQPPSAHSQRSPVIKFIPYNPGQSVLLPSTSSQTTPIVIPQNVSLTQPQAAAMLTGPNHSPKSAATTIAAAAALSVGSPQVQQQLQHTTYTIQHLPSAESAVLANNGSNSISSGGGSGNAAAAVLHRLASGGGGGSGSSTSVGAGTLPPSIVVGALTNKLAGVVGVGGVSVAAAGGGGGGTGSTNGGSSASVASFMSLPYGRRIVLLKCFGPLPDNLTTHSQLIISNLLVDLYRPSYFTLSNYSDHLALLPESCALLTICYLNSLRSGERIRVESLRTMIHYAQLGETDWLLYHKKHKKMSESTFVQSQLMHFSRIVVYPVQGKVRLVVSNQSLSEGITDTLQNLTQILVSSESTKATVPDYLVVMAIRPLSTIDFCILVLDPLQVQLLSEMKLLTSHHDSRQRRSHRQTPNGRSQHVSSSPGRPLRTLTSTNTGSHAHSSSSSSTTKSPSSSNEPQIDRNILFSVQSFHKKLDGDVLLPYGSTELRYVELKSCIAGSRWTTMSQSDAESMIPSAPHIIEHRPRGPFQDQYNVAMYMLQRILSSGAKSKIEDFQAVDFRVLCPPDATFVSQTISEIVSSGVIGHLTSSPSSNASSPTDGNFSFTTSAYAEAERRVICCSPKDSSRFQAFVKEVESNQNTLYLVVAENGHLTNSIVHSSSPSSNSDSGSEEANNMYLSDNQKLLCSFSNCILLFVSSHPYCLQTNRSLISPSNEIHWPLNGQLTRGEDTGLKFFSSADHQAAASSFKSTAANQAEEVVRFCEDQSFEEMFQNALINNCTSSSSFSEQILILRARLLLNQYAAALLVALGQSGRASCNDGIPLPETQQLVNHLVLDPLSSPRGYGSMILIRSHDIKIGKRFYQKLKALRDALGLQFRFEVIFDDGSHLLTVSDHFMKRLSKWGATTHPHTTNSTTRTPSPSSSSSSAAVPSSTAAQEQTLEGNAQRSSKRLKMSITGDTTTTHGRHSCSPSTSGGGHGGEHGVESETVANGKTGSLRGGGGGGLSALQGGQHGYIHSYKELEHLPCVVVLAGSLRAGLSFPSSLHFVDLRLCYPTGHVTRTCYEYDTTFFNGYYQAQSKTSPAAAKHHDNWSRETDHTEAMDTSVVACDDSDSEEVFEVSDSTPVRAGRVSESSHEQVGNSDVARMNSSSSSSCDDKASRSMHESPEPHLLLIDGTTSSGSGSVSVGVGHTISGQTVEWRPTTSTCLSKTDNGLNHHDGSGGHHHAKRRGRDLTPSCSDDLQQSPQNNLHGDGVHSGTVTVMIDPPDDEEQLFAESAENVGSRTESIFGQACASEEKSIDLFADLDDSDSEGEESEGTFLRKTCLLSRPYYHIWTSCNPQQSLLLLPSLGVTWYGGHKRPPLFDPDPQQQSVHYRKWTKPLSKEVRVQLDSIIRATNRSTRRSFLLSGPPQVGKTGAWLLMVRLLHSHLHSSQGVTVENPPPPSSIFVSLDDFKGELQHHLQQEQCEDKGVTTWLPLQQPGSPGSSPSRQSRIVSLECLEKIAKMLSRDEKNDSKPPKLISSNNTMPSSTIAKTTQLGSSPISSQLADTQHLVPSSSSSSPTGSTTSSISLPLSPYMMYDFTHSCSECSKHMRGNTVAQPDYLSSILPVTSGPTAAAAPQSGHSQVHGAQQHHITIKWCVPHNQQKHCVISQDRKTLERLKLPTFKFKGEKGAQTVTPIFTPTLGRDSSGLFNLFHSLPNHFHVLVTSLSEFKAYCKTWPHHIVMALPDQEVVGQGSTYHLLKQFVQHNFMLNTQSNMTQRLVWPLVAFMSDSIVMWKKLLSSGRTTDVSLSEVLHVMEQDTDSLDLVAMSAVPWSKQMEEGGASSINTVEELTDYDLSHDFIVLNLSKISSLTYNQFSLNSAQVGFNLKLQAVQMKTKLFREFAFVHKHLPSGGNPYPTQARNSVLVADIDKAIISLHHDSSSHLPYPGPYLMEHYLLYKSQVLFPYAQSPQFPVLVVDNYVSLGPLTHVTFIQSMSLASIDRQNSAVLNYKMDTLSRIRFSGLVLYLCEGKLSSEHLGRLNFVKGACLCLVTRDCKTLVREVARLDLEERWKFRLRDEYQTACADSLRPLFFLTGRFEG